MRRGHQDETTAPLQANHHTGATPVPGSRTLARSGKATAVGSRTDQAFTQGAPSRDSDAHRSMAVISRRHCSRGPDDADGQKPQAAFVEQIPAPVGLSSTRFLPYPVGSGLAASASPRMPRPPRPIRRTKFEIIPQISMIQTMLSAAPTTPNIVRATKNRSSPSKATPHAMAKAVSTHCNRAEAAGGPSAGGYAGHAAVHSPDSWGTAFS